MIYRLTQAVTQRGSAALVSALVVIALLSPVASAQNKALPRAGFGNYNYSGADTNNLPGAGGVHLNEGMDRRGNSAEVYNPGEKNLGMKLVRWDPRHMPLRVWVSPGKKLPEEPFSELIAHRPDEVRDILLSNPQSFYSLPQCPGWTPQMGQAAINGIEQWKELQNEGVIAFEFVDNPALAQIMVFWVDRFIDASGPGGNNVHGNTCATAFDVQAVRNAESRDGRPAQGAPVVIELRVNPDTEKLQGDSAHEFGHALGIKEHSPYRQDIMYLNRMVSLLSPADKATLRWLYKQPLQYVMLPPVVSPQLIQQAAAATNSTVPAQRVESAAFASDEPRPAGSGTYKITPLRKISDFPATNDGGSGDEPTEPVRRTPSTARNPNPADERPVKEKRQKGKSRDTEPPAQSVTGEPDEFQSALDEIRGIKRKERKPEPEKSGKTKRKDEQPSNADDIAPARNTVPENRPSDGY